MYNDVWIVFFFFSSRRRHTRCSRDWSSDVCSSDLLWGTELAPSHSRQICPAIHHCHNRIEQFRHRLWREESLCFRVPRSQSSRSTQPEGQRQHSLGSTRPRCQSLRVREEGRAAKSKARAGKASGGSAGGSRATF